jgi:predicted nucleic acid-binding protein
MTDPVFVDTNILIYCRDASEAEKQQRAMEWMRHLWTTRSGRLSIQVLQEFYAVVTGKLDPGLDPEIARADVRSLLTWKPVRIEADVIEAGCGYLLSEDLQEGQRFGNVVVVDPFQSAPGSLGS